MADHLLRVQDVIRRVFSDDQLTVTPETSAEDIEGWDSLMHINIVIAVEKEFGVRFATAEISNLKEEGSDVGDFLELVARKLELRQ